MTPNQEKHDLELEVLDLKLEILRLRALCRRAAKEIESIHDFGCEPGESPGCVNLLNGLDGRTSPDYLNCYTDLMQEFDELTGASYVESKIRAMKKRTETL